jgi:hypothetical protein
MMEPFSAFPKTVHAFCGESAKIEVPMSRRRFSVIFTVIVVFALLMSGQIATARVPNSEQRIVRAIERVRSAKGANAKVDAAQQLRNLVLATDAASIDDGTIHSVASLLDFNNEAIRYWIAGALGHFGTRARFAAPRLRAILAERECVVAETSSVSMVRDTLERIGEPAPARKCDHYILPK